jgi:hypothetical protein
MSNKALTTEIMMQSRLKVYQQRYRLADSNKNVDI